MERRRRPRYIQTRIKQTRLAKIRNINKRKYVLNAKPQRMEKKNIRRTIWIEEREISE